MRCLPQNKAQRRYLARLFPTMGVYILFVFLAKWLFKHHSPTGAMAYMLAVLPSLPIIAVLVIVGLYFAEETDEFERSIAIQAQLWGIGATLAITAFWGFLEVFLPVSHFPLYLTTVIYWTSVGIAAPLIRLRYR
jgi:hypothetical protein